MLFELNKHEQGFQMKHSLNLVMQKLGIGCSSSYCAQFFLATIYWYKFIDSSGKLDSYDIFDQPLYNTFKEKKEACI